MSKWKTLISCIPYNFVQFFQHLTNPPTVAYLFLNYPEPAAIVHVSILALKKENKGSN